MAYDRQGQTERSQFVELQESKPHGHLNVCRNPIEGTKKVQLSSSWSCAIEDQGHKL